MFRERNVEACIFRSAPFTLGLNAHGKAISNAAVAFRVELYALSQPFMISSRVWCFCNDHASR